MHDEEKIDEQWLDLLERRPGSDFATSVGRLMRGGPSPEMLIRVRGAAAARLDKLRGEDPAQAGEDSAALGAVTSLLSGYLEELTPTTDRDVVRARVLRHLAAHGPSRPSDLADVIGRRRSQVSTALRELVESGLAREAKGTTLDRRAVVYEATPDGRPKARS